MHPGQDVYWSDDNYKKNRLFQPQPINTFRMFDFKQYQYGGAGRSRRTTGLRPNHVR
jgi:hypothetical protein